MAMNQVQFQRGLSIAQFMDRYGSEEQCEAALMAQRWPDGFRSPRCRGDSSSTFVRGDRRYWRCTAYRCQSSLTSDTIFAARTPPPRWWLLAMHPHTVENSVTELWKKSAGELAALIARPKAFSAEVVESRTWAW